MKRRMTMLLGLALLGLPWLARSQDNFPTQPVRFVVPFSAGGGTDVIMRLIAKYMGEAWKVSVIVDNRVGAGGVVGSQHVAQQKPDGRTFLAVPAPSRYVPPSTANCPMTSTRIFPAWG